jgi:hypothetical protein
MPAVRPAGPAPTMIKSQCFVFAILPRFVDFEYFITANQANKSIVDVIKIRRREWLNGNINKKRWLFCFCMLQTE